MKKIIIIFFDFRISSEGKYLKQATSCTKRSLNSCRAWAGKNCDLSPEKAAEFAAAAALAAKKINVLPLIRNGK